MTSLKQNTLCNLEQAYGFIYIDDETRPELVSALARGARDLKKRTKRSLWSHYRLQNAVRRARSDSKSSDEAIARAYDQEYGGSKAAYGYVSAMLSQESFELITGLVPESFSALNIIDVGAGSNEFLRFCRDTLGISPSQLTGTDVSDASRTIIEADGFTGYVGRLEELALPKEQFDLAYLSYFIDYDTDQAATFDAAIDLIKPGGKIVLEGLFPVRPFGLLSSDVHTYSFVTKGRTVEEDIELVSKAFAQKGEEKGKTVRIEKVVKTHRYVQSQYGFHRLPSYFLVFSVTDAN